MTKSKAAEKNNGHHEEFDRDAMIATAISNSDLEGILDDIQGESEDIEETIGMQRKGVLQTLIHAILKDGDYRQVLLTATFRNEHQAVAWADAINEALRYGASIRPHVDRIIAMGSVGGRLRSEVVQAVSSYTINTPQAGGNKPKWLNRSDRESLS